MIRREYSILVADNEIAVVRSTIEDLKRIGGQLKVGLQLYPATSGSDVLKTLDEHRVDIVFLDYQFEGGMNGDEIIENITDPFGDILIVLMSAWEQKELEGVIFKRHKKLGERFKFLRKPFEFLEIQARFLEIDNFFKERRYPFPLAHAMSIMETRSTEQGRLSAMKDVVEAVLSYGAIILLSDLVRAEMHHGFQLGINWALNLTMGAWIKLLNKLLEKFSTNKSALFMPELYQTFFDKTDQPTEGFGRLFQFKDDLRDPVIGHGLTLDEGAYGLLASKYEDDVRRLYDSCWFLAKYHLMLVEKADFTKRDSEIVEYRARVLMGSESAFKLVRWNSEERLPTGEVYVHRWDGDVLPLYPLLLVATCSKCMAERLFLLANVKPRELEYNALCNHRYLDSKARQTFNSILSV